MAVAAAGSGSGDAAGSLAAGAGAAAAGAATAAGAGESAVRGAAGAATAAVLPSGRCSHTWPHLPHFTLRPEGASFASATSNRVAQLGQEAIMRHGPVRGARPYR
jgi:hypothetical protein